MKLTHPIGYQILDIVKNRDIDRFIYGMYRAERLPSLPTNSHSFRSLDLLGRPEAVISIPAPYSGLPSQPFEVKVESLSLISQSSRIYQFDLSCKEAVKFEGYSHVSQLGRFYSLTVNDKFTRLYTFVNFLNRDNVILLKALGLPIEVPDSLKANSASQPTEMKLVSTTDRAYVPSNERTTDFIPLLMKVYEEGTVPNMLVSRTAETIKLSPPKGLGLELADLPKGTVLIVAGGTGLYPFSDLIDLLYKDLRAKRQPFVQSQVFEKNPILRSRPFDIFKFRLLLAVESVEDIHPITLKQVEELNGSDTFSCAIKIKRPLNGAKLTVDLISEAFEVVLDRELKAIDQLSKVWLCGPPRMGQGLSEYFERLYP